MDEDFKPSDFLIGAPVGAVVFWMIGVFVLWLIALAINFASGDIPEIGDWVGALMLIAGAVAGVVWRRRDRLAKVRKSSDTP